MYRVGDRLHHIIKVWVHKELERLGSMHPGDLTKIPETALLRRGGMFVTAWGCNRGPRLLLYCLAAAIVRKKLQQTIHVGAAAYCKFSSYYIKEVVQLFHMWEDMLQVGAKELDDMQEQMKNVQAGTMKSAYFGDSADLPLQAKPELRNKALAALREKRDKGRILAKTKAASMYDMKEIDASPEPTLAARRQSIVEREKVTKAGALSQLAHQPGSSNAGLREPCGSCLKLLLKDCAAYKKHTAHQNSLIFDFQIHLVQQRFIALCEGDSARSRGEIIHSWIWTTLKKLHKKTAPERVEARLRMVGDVNNNIR